MRRIRIMEADGQAMGNLRRALHAAVEEFKKSSRREGIADRMLPPRALVITAKRSQPGQEKAEFISQSAPLARTPPTSGIARSRVADILYQLRKAEAEGKPTEALRQQLIEAASQLWH